jgi:hypothetical protein
MRENLEVLDEAVENARSMSRNKKNGRVALQWAKTLRDLLELRDRALVNMKTHALGRDQTGATSEPPDYFTGSKNPQVEFERYLDGLLSPWTREDLKTECEDCGVESQEVETRQFENDETESVDLCRKCYEKRLASTSQPEP